MSNEHEYSFADDDECLAALIDGELPPDVATAFAARLVNEPMLARRLAAMRRADRVLKAAYDPIAAEPLPRALVERLAVADLGARVKPRLSPAAKTFWLPTALAASVVLAVVAGLGVSVGLRETAPEIEGLAADALVGPAGNRKRLFDALESAPSGSAIRLARDVTARPRLTFPAVGGGYCRELDVTSPERRTGLIACRETLGWRVMGVAQVAGGGGGRDAGTYVAAGGPFAELDSIVDATMDGAPLGAADETAVIAAGWK